MPFPPSIKTIGVLSLSGLPNEQNLAKGRQRLEQDGMKVIVPSSHGNPCRYLAGSDEERIRQLNELLLNPGIDAILFARGGFGLTRIVNQLDWELIRRRNIPFIGYSDVSAFHLAALKHGCFKNIHGPMAAIEWAKSLDDDVAQRAFEETMGSLSDALRGEKDLLAAVPADSLQILKPGTGTGILAPTNLSILTSMIGTPSMPNLAGAILVIEDVHEAAYRIDGYLAHLKNAGILGALGGLVFGSFTDGEDAELLPEIFREYAQDVQGPVVCGLPFGHAFPSISLPVGPFVKLDASEDGISLQVAAMNQYEPHLEVIHGQTVNFRLMKPYGQEEGKEYPLLVVLHGIGERGQDNYRQLFHVAPSLLDDETRRQFPAFVCFPQCPDRQLWVNPMNGNPTDKFSEAPTAPMENLMALIDTLEETYPIDKRRVYIMGLSMGGFGAWDLITRRPKQFAAAIPICGGGDEEKAAVIKDIPLRVYHGAQDCRVPTFRSQNMVAALKKCGADPIYIEIPDCGHPSWPIAMKDPELLPWLFRQVNPNR